MTTKKTRRRRKVIRDRQLSVKLTAEQYDALSARASHLGLSSAARARQLIEADLAGAEAPSEPAPIAIKVAIKVDPITGEAIFTPIK